MNSEALLFLPGQKINALPNAESMGLLSTLISNDHGSCLNQERRAIFAEHARRTIHYDPIC